MGRLLGNISTRSKKESEEHMQTVPFKYTFTVYSVKYTGSTPVPDFRQGRTSLVFLCSVRDFICRM